MIERLKHEADLKSALDELMIIDQTLIPVVDKVDTIPLRLSEPGYESLAKIVVSQLISRKAADAIWLRLETGISAVSIDNIMSRTEDDLRQFGLSGAKARTLLTIANAQLSGAINFDDVNGATPDSALKMLTSLKGIGPWTAEVYLMFCCGHCDIFPAGDIALRHAAGHAFFAGEKPDEKHLREIAERWRPLRSVAARLLWSYYAALKQSDTNPI